MRQEKFFWWRLKIHAIIYYKFKSNQSFDLVFQRFIKDIQFRDEIISKVEKYTSDRQKVDSIMKSIDLTVLDESKHHLLTVCRPLHGVAEIDVAILRALLKKEKTDDKDVSEYYQSQLRLALKWNRIDIARNFIFTDENRDKV